MGAEDLLITVQPTKDIEVTSSFDTLDPEVRTIQIFADFPDGNDDDQDIDIVTGINNGTFDLDAATLANVASVVYKKNATPVTGVQSFAGGDILTIEITRTASGDASVQLNGSFT